jgi:TPR repeat protein
MDSTNHIDVFLSRKSEDAHLAKEIYDFLTSKGLKVFDSDITLAEIGNAEYNRVIDKVLEKTTHFILVCSSVDYVNTTYVYYEWDMFNYRKKIGDAQGNLIVILTKNIVINQLPLALRRNQIIFFDDFKSQLINFIPHINKGSEAKKSLSAEFEVTPKQAINETITSYQSVNFGDDFFKKGEKLYEDKKYEEAKAFLIKAASLGNSKAQNLLGLIYEEGHGIKGFHSTTETYKQAMQWYLKAAEQKNTSALINIGSLYFKGLGVTKDNEKACYWYEEAAKLGDASGISGFAHSFRQYEGEGLVWKSRAAKHDGTIALQVGDSLLGKRGFFNNKGNLALQFYKDAATILDYIPAQIRLGQLYNEGIIVKKDDETSKFWFIRAAKKGDEYAKNKLKNLYGITDY